MEYVSFKNIPSYYCCMSLSSFTTKLLKKKKKKAVTLSISILPLPVLQITKSKE